MLETDKAGWILVLYLLSVTQQRFNCRAIWAHSPPSLERNSLGTSHHPNNTCVCQSPSEPTPHQTEKEIHWEHDINSVPWLVSDLNDKIKKILIWYAVLCTVNFLMWLRMSYTSEWVIDQWLLEHKQFPGIPTHGGDSPKINHGGNVVRALTNAVEYTANTQPTHSTHTTHSWPNYGRCVWDSADPKINPQKKDLDGKWKKFSLWNQCWNEQSIRDIGISGQSLRFIISSAHLASHFPLHVLFDSTANDVLTMYIVPTVCITLVGVVVCVCVWWGNDIVK